MSGADRIRIAVAIARSGAASRRGAEDLIRAGRVRVDGDILRDLSRRVDPQSQHITVDDQPLAPTEPLRTYLLNKPRGVLSTAHDDRGRPTVIDLLPADAPRCVPVGRLDLDSEGLLLLSNDGPLIHALLHPSHEIPRVYLAEVDGLPSDESLNRIKRGINHDGDTLRATPTRSRRPGRNLGRGRASSWLTLTLHTGRKREVRRLCEAIGHRVLMLRRVRFGPILLRDLQPGQVRPLSRRELRLLRRAAGLEQGQIQQSE